MDVMATARRLAPLGVMAAGTGVAAGVASFVTVRTVGESDGGSAAQLAGALGGRPMVAGGLVGTLAAAVLGRTPWGRGFGPLADLALLPAGIAGAALGGALARRGLEQRHPDEYRTQTAAIDPAIAATQAMFRRAGADESTLERVPVRYDRAHLNATYHPPLGPFGNHIEVGRHSQGGQPLATDDVIAHEFAHKVVHEHAPWLARSFGGDARALHETLADTFAMAVDDEDWLVAEDAVPGGGRSFSHPELRGGLDDGQPVPAPITREQLESGTEEHRGAGVGNKAAWRIGSALGREAMATIYVAALERGELGFNASYEDLARAVRAAAIALHGAGSREAQVVDSAWRQAGY